MLITRHENEIGGTTDVASRSEFAGRRTKKCIDGEAVTGWFAQDFTLGHVLVGMEAEDSQNRSPK